MWQTNLLTTIDYFKVLSGHSPVDIGRKTHLHEAIFNQEFQNMK
jgi:hypothetical protein